MRLEDSRPARARSSITWIKNELLILTIETYMNAMLLHYHMYNHDIKLVHAKNIRPNINKIHHVVSSKYVYHDGVTRLSIQR